MALTMINKDNRVFGYVPRISYWFDITNNVERNPIIQIAESNGRLYCLDAAHTLWRFNDTTDYTANLDAGRTPLWTSIRSGVKQFAALLHHTGEVFHVINELDELWIYAPQHPNGINLTANKKATMVAMAHFCYQVDESGTVYELRDMKTGYKPLGDRKARAISVANDFVTAIDRTDGSVAYWNTQDRWICDGPEKAIQTAASGATQRNYAVRENGTVWERNNTNGQWFQLGADTATNIAASNENLFLVSAKDGGTYQYTGDHRKTHTWKRIGGDVRGLKLLAVDLA